ncbi:MAG TPA: DNA starvation/stationary phase protection protein [Prolixibacteraceae bacterium]|jgi:starvation-inducible DNA-binding protein|nr:DNA starvation/stationary phase protection protein [Prolixibacteraceae bacterium]
MKAQIGIKPGDSVQVADSLNRLLADEHVLYIKTRNAHWNVEGHDFYMQHKFFEEQYGQLEEMIDQVAERIRSIGHFSEATMQDFLKLTHLNEQSREKNDSLSFIKNLLEDHQSIIIHIRENIDRFAEEWHDIGSSDFITGLMEAHEKMAWMLRAHLS